MLGFDDVVLIFVVTTLGNLVVEVGAEVVAEWWVESPDSPFRPPEIDPSAAGISPDMFTEIAVKVDPSAPWSGQVMTLVNGQIEQSALMSGPLIQTLANGLGVQ